MTGPDVRRAVTRRRFLTVGGASALWIATGCRPGPTRGADAIATTVPPTTLPPTTLPPTPLPSTTIPSGPSAADDHVLVVVQLLGGNDGLNTVVPLDGRYRDARPGLAVPESDLIEPAGLDGAAFHPSLAPLVPMWDSGELAVVAGVGFEAQTRSHFESRDVWWHATGAPVADGWLTRWIDAAGIDRPDEPMEALALGVGPRSLAGSTAAAVSDPADVGLAPPPSMTSAAYEEFLLAVSTPDPSDPALLSEARSAFPLALSTQKILTDLIDDAASSPYDGQTDAALAVQLRAVASLIAARPSLRVVTVGIDGFDTHADQAATHADLLDTTAAALAEFWTILSPADRARTLVVTTTEFGRRVAENGSAGTDHGRASTQFVLGGGVAGGSMVGDYGLDRLTDGDLPIEVTGKAYFAEALRWLGGPIEPVLGVSPAPIGVLV